jgi:hypothetical protein
MGAPRSKQIEPEYGLSAVKQKRRRQYALRRHSVLVHELRMNAEELEGIIAAAKRAEAKKPLLSFPCIPGTGAFFF